MSGLRGLRRPVRPACAGFRISGELKVLRRTSLRVVRKLLISCEVLEDGNGQTPPNVIKVWRENVDAHR